MSAVAIAVGLVGISVLAVIADELAQEQLADAIARLGFWALVAIGWPLAHRRSGEAPLAG